MVFHWHRCLAPGRCAKRRCSWGWTDRLSRSRQPRRRRRSCPDQQLVQALPMRLFGRHLRNWPLVAGPVWLLLAATRANYWISQGRRHLLFFCYCGADVVADFFVVVDNFSTQTFCCCWCCCCFVVCVARLCHNQSHTFITRRTIHEFYDEAGFCSWGCCWCRCCCWFYCTLLYAVP